MSGLVGFLNEPDQPENQQAPSGGGMVGFLNAPARTEKTVRAERAAGKVQTIDDATLDGILDAEGATHLKPMVKAILGQESGGNLNVGNSKDGAVGPGQIIPGTFARLAHPGEEITNPNHNIAVSVRYIKRLADMSGNDPAKIAAGYFSGEGNIGNGATPYKVDAKDGNGKSVSSYVRDVMGRMGDASIASATEQDNTARLSSAPKWSKIVSDPRYADLTDEERQQARDGYFQMYIAPTVKPEEREAYRAWFDKESRTLEPKRKGFLTKAGEAIGNAASTVGDFASRMANNPDVPNPGYTDPMTGIDPSKGVDATGAPALPGSVMNDVPAQAPSASASLPVDPAARERLNAAWDKATPAQRKQLEQADGVTGILARERAASFAKLMPGSVMDSRIEATQGATGNANALGPQQAGPLDLAKDIGTAVKGAPNAFQAAYQALKEGDDPRAIDWKNKAIVEAGQRMKANGDDAAAQDDYVLGITREKVRNFPQQLAFSVLSMGAGLAAGIPASMAGTVVAPGVGTVAGMGAGATAAGVAAYRMDTNGFLRDIRQTLDDVAKQNRGTPLTDDEFVQIAQAYNGLVRDHGLWEALPEAASQVLGFGIGKMVFKSAAQELSKSLMKTAAGFGMELANEGTTETITQLGQHNAEVQAGTQKGKLRSFANPADIIKSAEEVMPDVLMLTGVMAGGAHAAGKVYDKVYNTPQRQIADAINQGVRGTKFIGIDDAARGALDPATRDTIDPRDTARGPQDVGPNAPLQQASDNTPAPAPAPETQTASAPALPPVSLPQSPDDEKDKPDATTAAPQADRLGRIEPTLDAPAAPDAPTQPDAQVLAYANTRRNELEAKLYGDQNELLGADLGSTDAGELTDKELEELSFLSAHGNDAAKVREYYPQFKETPKEAPKAPEKPAAPQPKEDKTVAEGKAEIESAIKELGDELGKKPAEQPKADHMVAPGEVLKSQSGRVMSPVPNFTLGSDRKTNNAIKAIDKWLLEEAKAEAKATGNDFMQTLLRAIDTNNMSQSDRDTLNLTVFGNEQGPTAAHRAMPPTAAPKTEKGAQDRRKGIYERASRAFADVLAKADQEGNVPLRIEQLKEQVANPARYAQIDEVDNPKGLKIGDRVTIGLGKTVAVVTSVTQRESKGAPVIEVHVNRPDAYGGWYNLDMVHKTDQDIEVLSKPPYKKGDVLVLKKDAPQNKSYVAKRLTIADHWHADSAGVEIEYQKSGKTYRPKHDKQVLIDDYELESEAKARGISKRDEQKPGADLGKLKAEEVLGALREAPEERQKRLANDIIESRPDLKKAVHDAMLGDLGYALTKDGKFSKAEYALRNKEREKFMADDLMHRLGAKVGDTLTFSSDKPTYGIENGVPYTIESMRETGSRRKVNATSQIVLKGPNGETHTTWPMFLHNHYFSEKSKLRWRVNGAAENFVAPPVEVNRFQKVKDGMTLAQAELMKAATDSKRAGDDLHFDDVDKYVALQDALDLAREGMALEQLHPTIPSIMFSLGLDVESTQRLISALTEEQAKGRESAIAEGVPNGQYGTVDQPMRFASGMSRPGDFKASFAENRNIGITIGELSNKSIESGAIGKAMAESKDAHLFVDSGAYSLFQAIKRAKKEGVELDLETGLPEGVKPLDFEKIIDKYERLAKAIGEADDSGAASERVFFVMPDIVGDQAGSLELANEWGAYIKQWGVQAIVPLQSGEFTLAEAFRGVMLSLGKDPDARGVTSPIIGIPTNRMAASNEELTELLEKYGHVIPGVHILGAASESKLKPRLDAIRAAGYDGNVSADATVIRKFLNDGPRADALQKSLKSLYHPTEEAPAEEAIKKPKTEKEAAEAKMLAEGKQEIEDALRELGDLLGKDSRAAIMPEQHEKVVTILTKLMGGLVKVGFVKFKQASREAMRLIREKLGDDIADDITLDHLQGAYIGMRGLHKDKGVDSAKEVSQYESLDELLADEAPQGITFSPLLAGMGSERARLVKALAKHFAEGNGFASITEARDFAKEHLGREVKAGTLDAKLVDEAVETAAVLYARHVVQTTPDAAVVYDKLVDFYDNRMPNLKVRTSTSITQQAYSTPLPLAWLGSQLAGITDKTTVYEATAGNGALLIGTNPKNAIVNELNGDRAMSLSYQGFEVHRGDATEFKPGKKVDVVYINPPFGKLDGKTWEVPSGAADGQYTTGEIDHAISLKALQSMKDNGRAVLIVGGVSDIQKNRADAYLKSKPMKEFYLTLYNDYKVVDHFTVDGALYDKQGAGWPVDVIVIDGKGKSALSKPWMEAPRVFASWEELKGKLDENNSVDAAGKSQLHTAGDGGSGAGVNADAGGPSNDGGAPAAGAGGRVAPDAHGTQQSDRQQPDAGRVDGQRGQPGQRGDGHHGVDAQPPVDGRGAAGGADQNADAGSGGTAGPVGGNERGGMAQPRVDAAPVTRKKEETTATQSDYEPRSKLSNVGTLVPVNMRDAVAASLAHLEERVGPVDDYVMRELAYPDKAALSKAFSAEQVDALALALDNLSRDGGFIIGDQTGIGKGRVNAGIIRWALLKGMTPVFVTQKPNLYGDMFRDLNDIGQKDIRILMTNADEKVPLDDEGTVLKTPASAKHNAALQKMINSGKLADDYNVVFTTYDSLNTKGGAKTVRMSLVEMVAHGSILILDEAHSAGGQVKAKNKVVDILDRASFFRGLVRNAKGVFYSSATYAKRPDVMDLYAKTEMRLAVANPKQLGPTIAAGGIPMQQVVAAMLARSGQYIRRERTFAGVQYNTDVVPVNRQIAENTATVMRMIMDFDKAKKKAVAGIKQAVRAEAQAVTTDGSTGGAGAESTNFTSIMHNLIGQMLLALKAPQIASAAIEQIKENKKPVITVANTMESLMEEFVKEHKVRVGDAITLTFGDLLKRYLEKSRYITVKKPFQKGKGDKRRLSDAELGEKAVAIYNAVHKFIDAQDWAQMAASPIDQIKEELRKAGYTSSEITGRKGTIDYSGKAPVYRVRKASEVNVTGRRKAISDFNNGRVDVMILNQAGSTGLSLHASPAVGKDTRQRVMILGQAELNVDTHMQMLGRVHRTGQIIVPIYSQLTADIPAENRPAAVIAKKMGSLSANTTGNKQSALQSEQTPDFLNEIGDEAVANLMWNDQDMHDRLGEPLDMNDTGDNFKFEDAARKVTGRIPVLPLAEQEALYKQIEDEYRETLKNKEALGEAGLEAKSMDLRAKPLVESTVDEGTPALNSEFAGPVKAMVAEVNRLGKPYTSEQVMHHLQREVFGHDDAAADLDVIQEEANRQLQQQIDQVRKDFSVYSQTLAADMDERAAQQVLTTLRLTMDKLQYIAANFAPGTTVEMRSPLGEIRYGVIAGFEKRGEAKNPAAGSVWKVTIFLADSAKQVTLSVSKLAGEGQDEGYYQLKPVETDEDGTNIMRLFDSAQKIAREKRTIITGNLLRGFSQFKKGQIVNFTMEDGSVQPGILMPRGFDLEEETRKLVRALASPDEALSFIEKNPRGRLVSEDGDASIRRMPNGTYRFLVPASKKDGARFFQNKNVLETLEHGEMIKSGGRQMQGDVKNLPKLLGALYGMDVALKGMTAQQIAEANGLADIGRDRPVREGLSNDGLLSEIVNEGDQLRARQRLSRLSRMLEEGRITQSEFTAAVRELIDRMGQSANERANRHARSARTRGELWVREKLLNASRRGLLDPQLVDMAMWLLNQNPNLANDLGISIRRPGQDTPSGLYRPLSRVITLFQNATPTTAVHEIMHHAERMMPPDVQDGIRREWAKAWRAAMVDAASRRDVAELRLLSLMIDHNLGDQSAWDQIVAGFNSGKLDYDRHYQLVNPSEFWAVNAERILSQRYDTEPSWVRRAGQWLREFVERIKGALGLRSDAPVLRALDDVLNTNGAFESESMLHAGSDTFLSIRSFTAKASQSAADWAYYHFGPSGDTFKRRHKTINTQLHKSLIHPGFRPVFKASNALLNHVSLAAMRSAELAPSLLPAVHQIATAAKTIFAGTAPQKQIDAVGRALWLGTLKGKEASNNLNWTVDDLINSQGGSIYDGRVWTPRELETKFGMDRKERDMYYEARAAIDQSLEEAAASTAWAMSHLFLPAQLRDSVIEHVDAAQAQIEHGLQQTIAAFDASVKAIEAQLDSLRTAKDLADVAYKDLAEQVADWQKAHPGQQVAKNVADALNAAKARAFSANADIAGAETRLAEEMRRRQPVADAIDKVKAIYETLEKLQRAGYAPLSRFGQYTVEVVKLDNGRPMIAGGQKVRPYFARFDNEADARKAILALRKKYNDPTEYQVSDKPGKIDPEEYRNFQGISPETLALFAEVIGAEKALEKFYVHAVSDRSIFKHYLHREGIAGYSEDLPRVLASFITSNARYAAHRFYLRDIDRAIAYNKRHYPKDGDLHQEARELKQAIIDPVNAAPKLRAALFAMYLGGSVAAAAINATQSITMTLPYLSMQAGYTGAALEIGKAMLQAMGLSKIDPTSPLAAALKRAALEGRVDAQEIFHLYSVAIAGVTSRIGGHSARNRVQAALTLWSSMFSLIEEFNRRTAFIAAFNIAQNKGLPDPAGFASDAVDQTQFIYNKSNVPNLMRNTPGALLMTFKMFPIAYTELQTRMWKQPGGKKAVIMSVAMLMLFSGLSGLPFMKAIEDLIDTLGQLLGYNTNSKRWRREVLDYAFGGFGEFLNHGISAILPFDVSQRMGLHNILPSTDLFKKSNDEKLRSASEALGAVSGVAKQVMDAWQAIEADRYLAAGGALLPKAIRDIGAGAEMATTGKTTDTKGRKVADTGLGDATFQALGFNPNVKAKGSMLRTELYQDKKLAQIMQEEVSNQFARGIENGDPAEVSKAFDKMNRWNKANPEWMIQITRDATSRRVKAGLADADERMIQATPKRQRPEVLRRLKE